MSKVNFHFKKSTDDDKLFMMIHPNMFTNEYINRYTIGTYEKSVHNIAARLYYVTCAMGHQLTGEQCLALAESKATTEIQEKDDHYLLVITFPKEETQ